MALSLLHQVPLLLNLVTGFPIRYYHQSDETTVFYQIKGNRWVEETNPEETKKSWKQTILFTSSEPENTSTGDYACVISLTEFIRQQVGKYLSDDVIAMAVQIPGKLVVAGRIAGEDELSITETLLDDRFQSASAEELKAWLKDNRVLDLWEKETGREVPVITMTSGEPVHPVYLPGFTEYFLSIRQSDFFRKMLISRLLYGWWLGPGLITLAFLVFATVNHNQVQTRYDDLLTWQSVNRSRIDAWDHLAKRQEFENQISKQFGSGLSLKDWISFHQHLPEGLRIQSVQMDFKTPDGNILTGYCATQQDLTTFMNGLSRSFKVRINSFQPVSSFNPGELKEASGLKFRFSLGFQP